MMQGKIFVSAPRIRAARAWVGETQAKFAERFAVSRSTVAKWELLGGPNYGPVTMLLIRVLEDIEGHYGGVDRRGRSDITAPSE